MAGILNGWVAVETGCSVTSVSPVPPGSTVVVSASAGLSNCHCSGAVSRR